MNDIKRLINEYEERNYRLAGSNIYSWFDTANLFAIHQRQRTILKVLKKHGFTNLRELAIFEMGCGKGGVLTEYLNFGADPQHLFGVDLIFDRLQTARKILRGSGIIHADGQTLPFSSRAFELVFQSTALSSVLDLEVRKNICAEMLRVLKPGGMILSYDFWLNPTNLQTRGLRPSEIRILFPDCRLEFYLITLAPPITRRIASFSWILCLLLENLKIFNTHYLVAIFP